MNPSTDPGAAIRWGERLPVDLPVHIQASGATAATGRMRNVSVSGALIETDALLKPPVSVNVEFAASELGRARLMSLEGVVVRCADGYIGLEWRDVACQPLVELLQGSQR